jgi:MFS family permease
MYLLSGLINIVSCIISAQSKNIAMLVVFRALQSFGANAGLTLGAGVIADCIPVEVRGTAYGFFYM